jgi:hypothetical protein
MRTKLKYIFILVSLLNPLFIYSQTQSIQQKLLLINSTGINGGAFTVDYQIKGTNLTSANTLASLNADIIYDSTAIRFIEGTDWHPYIMDTNGYATSIQSNAVEDNTNRSVRIVITAPEVNNQSPPTGSPGGYDLNSQYESVVRMNFIILDNTRTISLIVKTITNQIGLFINHSNNPNTFEITSISLSPPENIVDQLLPVLLASFNSSVNGRDVKLAWKTTSENGNNGFDIERYSESKWNKVGFVKGAGNKNTPTDYSYTDAKLNSGKYKYRLKQIDFNGHYEYFNLQSDVTVGVPVKYDISQNYPNPFNPSTKIDFSIPYQSNVSIKLFDVAGREVKTVVNQSMTSGYYTVQMNANDLSSGAYFYRLFAEGTEGQYVMTRKMMVVK